MTRVLIYGINGFIGNFLKKYIILESKEVTILNSVHKRLKSKQDILDDIKTLKPDKIISSIGFVKTENCTNTTFLDDNKYLEKNIEINLYIHNLIMSLCVEHNIHFTYIGTGCIFGLNKDIYDNDDEPDYFKNNYAIVKGFTDKLLSLNKDKILILRIRQCMSEIPHPQNFLTKFLSFKKVNDIKNSYTIVPSIFPLIAKLILEDKKGIFNCVNKGSISIMEINKLVGLNKLKLENNNYANNILLPKNLEKYYDIENINDALIKLKKNISI